MQDSMRMFTAVAFFIALASARIAAGEHPVEASRFEIFILGPEVVIESTQASG